MTYRTKSHLYLFIKILESHNFGTEDKNHLRLQRKPLIYLY